MELSRKVNRLMGHPALSEKILRKDVKHLITSQETCTEALLKVLDTCVRKSQECEELRAELDVSKQCNLCGKFIGENEHTEEQLLADWDRAETIRKLLPEEKTLIMNSKRKEFESLLNAVYEEECPRGKGITVTEKELHIIDREIDRLQDLFKITMKEKDILKEEKAHVEQQLEDTVAKLNFANDSCEMVQATLTMEENISFGPRSEVRLQQLLQEKGEKESLDYGCGALEVEMMEARKVIEEQKQELHKLRLEYSDNVAAFTQVREGMVSTRLENETLVAEMEKIKQETEDCKQRMELGLRQKEIEYEQSLLSKTEEISDMKGEINRYKKLTDALSAESESRIADLEAKYKADLMLKDETLKQLSQQKEALCVTQQDLEEQMAHLKNRLEQNKKDSLKQLAEADLLFEKKLKQKESEHEREISSREELEKRFEKDLDTLQRSCEDRIRTAKDACRSLLTSSEQDWRVKCNMQEKKCDVFTQKFLSAMKSLQTQVEQECTGQRDDCNNLLQSAMQQLTALETDVEEKEQQRLEELKSLRSENIVQIKELKDIFEKKSAELENKLKLVEAESKRLADSSVASETQLENVIQEVEQYRQLMEKLKDSNHEFARGLTDDLRGIMQELNSSKEGLDTKLSKHLKTTLGSAETLLEPAQVFVDKVQKMQDTFTTHLLTMTAEVDSAQTTFTSKFRELEKRLGDRVEELGKLEETTIKSILDQLHQSQESSKRADGALAEQMKLANHLKIKRQSLEEVLASSKIELNDASVTIASLRHECDEKSSLLEQCKHEFELLEKKFKTEINEWEEKSSSWTSQLEGLKKIVQDQRLLITEKEQKIDQMEAAITKQESNINSSEETCDHYRDKAEELEYVKHTHKEDKTLTENKVQEQIQEHLRKMTSALAAVKQELSKKESELEKASFQGEEKKWCMDASIYLNHILNLTANPEDRKKSIQEIAFLLGVDSEEVESLLTSTHEEENQQLEISMDFCFLTVQTDHGVVPGELPYVDFSSLPGPSELRLMKKFCKSTP